MKYESSILKRLVDTYGVVGNPRYISEIIKEFIVRGKERFPNLFTYQSDWLAHIDEFGLNPTYTVSYTGQSIYAPNTLERPVKSAILKGQTLVNLIDRDSIKNVGAIEVVDGIITWTDKVTGWVNGKIEIEPTISIVNGKIYTLIFKCNQERAISTGFIKGGTWQPGINIKTQVGVNTVKITSTATDTNFTIQFIENTGLEIYDIILLEGDYTNVDIPYFEGMQSVRMPVLKTTGKNLFDGVLFDGKPTDVTPNMHYKNTGFIEVKSNESYAIQSDGKMDGVYFFNKNKEVISTTNTPCTTKNIITPEKCKYISVQLFQRNEAKIQIEEGTQATIYEPYKTNILSTSEDVILRGIGDVKDELDLLTGEVVQNIDEIVLDGSEEDWFNPTTRDNLITFRLKKSFLTNTAQHKIPNDIICDKLPLTTPVKAWANNGYIPNSPMEISRGTNKDDGIDIIVDMDRMTEITNLVSFKQWLNNNHLTVQYQLAEKPIKTVDLTILDQNGQNVEQLISFNGGTHFTTRSSVGSPLPTVSVCVETDLEETLMMCSLEGYTL